MRPLSRITPRKGESGSDSPIQSVEKIARDVDRDYIMEAHQAVEYGIVDRVISSRELPGPVK